MDKHWAKSKDDVGKDVLVQMENFVTKDGIFKSDINDQRVDAIQRNLQELLASPDPFDRKNALFCTDFEKVRPPPDRSFSSHLSSSSSPGSIPS